MARDVAPMGTHSRRFTESKSGDTFTLNRKPKQTDFQFKNQCQNLKSTNRIKHGIASEFELFDTHAVFKIVRGADNPLPESERHRFHNPRKKKASKHGPVVEVYRAPPKAEESPQVEAKPEGKPEMRDDESAFWREIFKTSLQAAPSADPTRHVAAARAGVEAYRARFAQ